jgi:hypothetical protein
MGRHLLLEENQTNHHLLLTLKIEKQIKNIINKF